VTISGFTIRNGNYTSGGSGGIGVVGTSPPYGVATVTNCWIKDNQGRGGGGIGIDPSCTLQMSNCTISGNSSPSGYGGGGIFNSGTMYVTNCTIAGNLGNGESAGHGGGFYNVADHTMNFQNTIVAGNTGTIGNNAENLGTVNSLGNNLDSSSTGECGFGQLSDQNNVDPQLIALADNGGPTPTIALNHDLGSTAIDGGICHDPDTAPNVPTRDQRGINRPQGAGCDIGAYEYVPVPTIISVSPSRGYWGQTIDVEIHGNYFLGVTYSSFGQGITVNSQTVSSAVLITANITIPEGTNPGYHDVEVGNVQSASVLNQGFLVNVTDLLSAVYVTPDGNDDWDGSSATHTTGNVGPKQFIASAYLALADGGTINVSANDGAFEELGSLKFTKSLTLAGDSARWSHLTGTNSHNLIWVEGYGVNVTISGLTIEDGTGPVSAGGLGVTNGATVTVNDCVIKDCIGRNGGGVGVDGGCTLNMNRCTVNNNSPLDSDESGGGGVLNNGGTVNLTNCTIDGNYISNGAQHGYGAGISNFGTMTLTNCTISHNNNQGDPGQGGGFYNAVGCIMTFQNTIVARNIAITNNNGYNNGGTITSLGHNITDDDEGFFTGSGAGPGDNITDPRIADDLHDNYGPTRTVALLTEPDISPAIDAGATVAGVTTDQRGVTRPQGSAFDIGAFELVPQPVVSLVNPGSGDMGATLNGVVITGEHLEYTTGVNFIGGDIGCEIQNVDSDTQLTVDLYIEPYAPAGARDVQVNTYDGTGTLDAGFTVMLPPIPAVPVLSSPASGATVSTITPTLAWNAAASALDYDVQLATTYTFATKLVDATGITGPSYNVTSGLNWAKTYYWHARSHNSAGNSAWSAYRTFRTSVGPPPIAPSNLTATAILSNKVQLHWQDNSTNETGFKIERKTGAGGTYAQVGTVGANVTTFTNTGPIVNTTYFYRVKAYNLGGSSVPSNEVSAMTLAAPVLTSPAIGATVTTLTPTLTWNASTNAASYNVQVATTTTFTTPLVNDSTTSLSYDITGGLNWNTYYYWRVNAQNDGGTSSWSTARRFKTSVGPPPDAPSDLTAVVQASNKVKLDWVDNSGNETGFKIERKTGAGAYSQVGMVGAGIQTYTNISVSGGNTYTYRVRAYNLGGPSGYTNECPVTVLKAPTLLSPTSGATGQSLTPTLTWNAVTSATTYSLQVATNSTFTSVVVDVNSIGVPSYDIPGPLNPLTTYYWHVSAQNSDGTSSWSTYRSFKTGP